MTHDDAFFEAEVQEGRRVRQVQPHRLILTAAVVFALGWLMWPTKDELAYHFSSAEIVDLGDVTALDPGRELPLEVPARVTGVLGNKAAVISGAFRPGSYRSGPVQIRQLLGAPIFVEFDQEALGDEYTAFTRVTVEGRLSDFGPRSELSAARGYFWERFGMSIPDDARVLVVGEMPGTMWRYPILLAVALLLAATSVTFAILGLRRRVVVE
jgi:hypothetical protein